MKKIITLIGAWLLSHKKSSEARLRKRVNTLKIATKGVSKVEDKIKLSGNIVFRVINYFKQYTYLMYCLSIIGKFLKILRVIRKSLVIFCISAYIITLAMIPYYSVLYGITIEVVLSFVPNCSESFLEIFLLMPLLCIILKNERCDLEDSNLFIGLIGNIIAMTTIRLGYITGHLYQNNLFEINALF